MTNRKRRLPYLVGGILLLMLIVFVARTLEISNYSGLVILRVGLFYDRVCYKGSYEMIVCPYTAPPYETLWAILSILLIISIWTVFKKK